MKTFIFEFFRRGLIACGFGPMILVILYLILYHLGEIQLLTVPEVCLGIVSLSTLAFVVGGMNAVYQLERLPLTAAIFIHGSVLYISYLVTYLLNSWLEQGLTPILIFSVIFVVGYLLIWAIIYFVTHKRTVKINEILEKKRGSNSNFVI